jgi:hypothetical protein
MDKKYLETTIVLARMYGIAETLNPWDYLENEDFIAKITEWADEFMGMEAADILAFFESKIK